MSKITNIPSEIRNFFSEKHRSIVMDTFTRLLENLNLYNRSLGGLKSENCLLTNLQVFQILLLFPFFAIKGFSHYDGSALCCMFGGKKDVLYSYLSQDNINWRNVIYRITNWLLTKVTVRQDHKKSLLPTVLIADDTDLPKTGMHMDPYARYSRMYTRSVFWDTRLLCCVGVMAARSSYSTSRFMVRKARFRARNKGLPQNRGTGVMSANVTRSAILPNARKSIL